MSKTKCHVLKDDGSLSAACGVVSVYRNAFNRVMVTCAKCKKTPEYKKLPRGNER